jgi:hypothetical protein
MARMASASICNPRYYQPLPNTLYRNNGDGTFTDVSAQTGIAAHLGAAWEWRLPIMTATATPTSSWPTIMPNQLFHNIRGKRFEEVALEAGVAFGEGGNVLSGMGVDFRDVRNDGLPGHLDDCHRKADVSAVPESRWHGQFAEKTAVAGLGMDTFEMSGWGNGIADLDNDGWKDLFVARSNVDDNVHQFSPRTYEEPNAVFRNMGNMGQGKRQIQERKRDGGALLPNSGRAPRAGLRRSGQ